MSESVSFFIAGTMQGAREGSAFADQSYRLGIVAAIREAYPSASIRCPLVLMSSWCRGDEALYRQAHDEISRKSMVARAEYSERVRSLTDMFAGLVRLAGESDVLVSCLPDREPSMGTAAEMWSAFSQGKLVIAITRMTRSLAVLGMSHVIVPDIKSFSEVLASDWLSQRLAAGH